MKTPSASDARNLYAYFLDHGYSESALSQTLGFNSPPLPQMRNLPRLLEKTQEPTPMNLLVRWFLGNQPATNSQVADAGIPPWFIQSCLDHGLLTQEHDTLHPTLQISTCGQLLVASDTYQHLYSPEGFDHVLTINPAALHLVRFTQRIPVQSTLDLAAGNGIQALFAAPHSQTVVTTDLNPRATEYASFNAQLNGFSNIECLTGDLLEPVKNRTFDLIVCNPPFVLAPSKDYLYRDNDFELDGLSARLCQTVPSHLNEGAYYQMICEWVEIEGQTWEARLQQWCENNGCDVWVFKEYSKEPADYALTRLRETQNQSPEKDIELYNQWMTYYRHHKIRKIHGGLIALRRRSEKVWFQSEDISGTALQEPFGDLLLQRFKSKDFLIAHSNHSDLLATRLSYHPQLQILQSASLVDGSWRFQPLSLSHSRHLTKPLQIQQTIAQFLTQFDGKRTVAQIIQTLSEAHPSQASVIQKECLQTVRLFLERGFLLAP